ncbi:hypothetical protein CABS03_04487 [Colletotrichum abscissum]|uniref:Uncharacterized protein n=2 Tax=Colletotrichum acutatum species complex TaxID=2707335 RepID=A0A9P9XD33_9PEZI|nr:hypothetical protein CABS02_08236 [Colletotrichum abscissum]KAK0382583.1 hypothetical protein CLIM01_00048 [Colletotrichum limetticola]KAK1702639.1 hypothetical protein BDP67DRAFT_537371 [Colletotrichum lupini]
MGLDWQRWVEWIGGSMFCNCGNCGIVQGVGTIQVRIPLLCRQFDVSPSWSLSRLSLWLSVCLCLFLIRRGMDGMGRNGDAVPFLLRLAVSRELSSSWLS